MAQRAFLFSGRPFLRRFDFVPRFFGGTIGGNIGGIAGAGGGGAGPPIGGAPPAAPPIDGGMFIAML